MGTARRHSIAGRIAAFSLLLVAAVWPQRGLGQTVEAAALIGGADAIVMVEVAFVPYGDMVLVGEVLHGQMRELSSSNELLGVCLPGKAAVRELAQGAGTQAAVYAESIERAGYSAVVFVQHAGGRSELICSTGPHSTENWLTDPRYPAWRARLDGLIESRE